MIPKKLILILLVIFLTGCQRTATPTVPPASQATNVLVSAETTAPAIPAWQARQTAVAIALTQPIPVLRYPNPDSKQAVAQDLALQDERFTAGLYDPQSNQPLRSEILAIYPARPSDLTTPTTACQPEQCYRVELYHYAYNFSRIALVDLATQQVLQVNTLDNAQPDIPPHLTDLAVAIALASPEVQQYLGSVGEAVMPNIKTALNRSQCERSRHLCVAPTFLGKEKALWAIVDLTDGKLIATRWTNLGDYTPVTEKTLQDETLAGKYCDLVNTVSQDGWQFSYQLTSSDGMVLRDVQFNGKPVLRSAKLVDWHVSYDRAEAFGYSDAIGCPIFSQAAVVPFAPPEIAPLTTGPVAGFVFTQNFRSALWPAPCNYNYEQRFEFYRDGSFRVVAGNLGRGCGDNGTYRPVLRLAFAEPYQFSEWDGTVWKPWTQEDWHLQTPDTALTATGAQYRLQGANGAGYDLVPGNGQFGDGGQGDHAYSYVSRWQPDRDEGESDMPTLGSCCNADYQQGPEQFTNEEPLSPTDHVVLWYVPQMENEATPGQEYCWADGELVAGVYVPRAYPCYSGPKFVPLP
jgi:hypothetical protein